MLPPKKPTSSVVIDDLKYQHARDLLPVEATVGLRRDGFVIRLEYEPLGMHKIDSDLTLAVAFEFMAAGAGELAQVTEGVSRPNLRESLPKHPCVPVTEFGAHLLRGIAQLLDLP